MESTAFSGFAVCVLFAFLGKNVRVKMSTLGLIQLGRPEERNYRWMDRKSERNAGFGPVWLTGG